MKFAVYQIKLSDAQYDLINTKGHDAVPAHKAKLDMMMDFDGVKIGGLASDAMINEFYTHVANIEATDYNNVFEIGNSDYDDDKIERLINRVSSVSVGDVIVSEDGTCVVVASTGFVAFSFNPKLAA